MRPEPLAREAATGVGFLAVLSWALLALLTVGTGRVPPFQLCAVCFAVGGVIGLAVVARRGGLSAVRTALSQPLNVWAVGVGGIFGYHFFYFTALRNAPPAEASLIAYLWPLLIVVFSGLLPQERLRPGHVAGALLGLFGAGLLITDGGALSFDATYMAGYAAALAGALVWSGYSVLNRVIGKAGTGAVAGFCLCSALLATVCHLALEVTVWPGDALSWLALVALGLGPVGGAFYVWDIGVKYGDLQLLGVASYAAPLLSTAILVLAGIAPATPELAIAAIFITGGAAIAAASTRRGRRPKPAPVR